MRLFLCAMLARRPVVSQAIVTGLNGARFFDLYVPELGLELRIQSEDIQPAPMLADWNKDARYAPPTEIPSPVRTGLHASEHSWELKLPGKTCICPLC